MSTNLIGEIATLLAITALAGILIGWCIKSLFTGRGVKVVREQVARSVDDATADVRQLQGTLEQKDNQLREATLELQQLRGRDVSLKAGHSTQIEEINKLKNELATSRQTLDRNLVDFNEFRNEKQTEVQAVTAKLASFQAGGPVHDERIKESSETISALRTAVRENDKVIDSLRARVKEGDSSVDNLRNQLKISESTTQELQASMQTNASTTAQLSSEIQGIAEQRDKYKHDYDQELKSKTTEIKLLQDKLEDLGAVQAQLQMKEQEYNKLNLEKRDIAARGSTQITDLKRTISDGVAAQAQAQKELKDLRNQVQALTRENQTKLSQTQQETSDVRGKLTAATRELEKGRTLQSQLETKDAEIAALNDMLRDVSGKRDQVQSRVTDLDKQLNVVKSDAAATIEAQRRITALSNTVKERDAVIVKLRTEMDDVVASRNSLGLELGEVQTKSAKAEQAIVAQAQEQLTSANQTMKEREHNVQKLRADMESMVHSRDMLSKEVDTLKAKGTELESFKASMQETVAKRESEVNQRKVAYEKLQREFDQIANTRDDYEQRLSTLRTQIDEQARNSEKEITQLKQQIAELRSKLSLADSEKQRLSEELSKAEGLRLTITERDADLQKLHIDLQDANAAAPAKVALAEHQKKTQALTSALQERDTEISRLSSVVTDNRLASKKLHSESSLLQQEIDSQGQLIRSLEEQAENTLTLHKKIATQSTEIEELRAQLYQQDDTTPAAVQSAIVQADNQELVAVQSQLQSQKNETLMVRQQLEQSRQRITDAESESRTQATDLQRQNDELKAELGKIQNDLKRSGETRSTADKPVRQSQTISLKTSSPATTTSTTTTSDTKPRVFVRQDATAESITGVPPATGGRALYTRDGYKLKLQDGSDDLCLLPGIEPHTAQELKQNGVVDFEQIALWTRREVIHYADRSGIAASKAESYNWPSVAKQIIQGSYRRTAQTESDAATHS